ncbi:MAG: SpoIIE family protein phosphatase, partial [Cyclobacteriaceae bacterium]
LIWDVAMYKDRLYIMHFDGISYLEDRQVVNLDRHGFSTDGGADLLVGEDYLLAGSLSGLYLCENPGDANPAFTKYPLYTNSTFHYLLISKDQKTLYAIRNSFYLVRFTWDPDTHQLSEPQRLATFKEEINDFWEDNDGHLWVAHDLGLTLLDFRSSKRTELIEGMPVNQIVQLGDNQLALATSGYGLTLMEVQDWRGQRFEKKNIGKKDGLASNNVYSLEHTDSKTLWAGTENGINRISLSGNIVKSISHYSDSEGFSALETNHKAVTSDEDGNIWWGTVGGVTRYDPRYEKEGQALPEKVLLTGLDLFYKSIDWSRFAETTGWFQTPVDLSLPHDQNHLTFRFTTTRLAGSKKVRYSHRLEGLEENWSPPTPNREAVYANIPPGGYRFQVRATLDGYTWSNQPVSFPVIIRQPFYTTWWFVAILLSTLTILGFILARHQLGKVKASRDRLARKVRERTAEIEKQKEVLATKHDELEIKSHSLQEALNQLSSKNFQITSSISYAKRIQEAILPRREDLTEGIGDAMVFYKPRDIVSGDFYWMARREECVYFAVVDCTGHGVPGAFMSMIGYNQLHIALDSASKPGPVQILEHMDREVMRVLKQDSLEQETQDGMDVALIMLDKAAGTLTFAGAKRPLYLVFDGELEETKGARNPIGGSLESGSKIYQEHTIPYRKGCMVYLTTDGFADQFGGRRDRKFMIGKLKKLLASAAHLPSDQQYEVLSEAFDEWKRNYDQTDDVLIVGIRLP